MVAILFYIRLCNILVCTGESVGPMVSVRTAPLSAEKEAWSNLCEWWVGVPDTVRTHVDVSWKRAVHTHLCEGVVGGTYMDVHGWIRRAV